MKIEHAPVDATYDELQQLRKNCDCIMFDHKKIKGEDSFAVDDPHFDIRKQPLRLVVIKLEDLDRSWSILNDQLRRNTMIIASDEDVRLHPEISRYLESQGVALLMCKSLSDSILDSESLLKSLNSLKFKHILVEDSIDLLPFF